MTITPEMNRWFAEKVGLNLASHLPKSSGHSYLCALYFNYERSVCSFDISDANDRELCREKFNISTHASTGKWFACTFSDLEWKIGDTLAEAELACLTAIYQSQAEGEGDDQ